MRPQAASDGVRRMFRGSLAGVMLALSASTALAANINFSTAYTYETWSSASAAAGTSVAPPSGGLGNVGGLCTPGTGGCPTLFGNAISGPLTGGLITFNTPSLVPGTNYILQLTVNDDATNLHATGFPSNTAGDTFEVLLNGNSLGFTSVTGVQDHSNGSFSTGSFQTVIGSGPGAYTIGLTDLLQPYADGLTDNLPGVLCGVLPGGTAGCSPSPVNGGTVSAAAYGSNILDFEASITPVPEPTSIVLLGSGLLAMSAFRRRRAN